ncbi:MAG: glycosyltransferase family 87 protein [Phycisphaerae bacterium]
MAVLFVGLGVNVHYRAAVSAQLRSDFLVFHAAGRAVLAGEDPYAVRHPRGWGFFYPPTMAALMTPFALLPAGQAAVAWYAVSVFALLWSARRVHQLVRAAIGGPAGWVVLLAFLANFGPIVSGLQRGQISVVLFALGVEAIWHYAAGRRRAAGVWVALGAALKVYPLLLLLVPLVRRDGRTVLGFAAALVLLATLPPAIAMGPARAWDATRTWTRTVLLPFAGAGAAQGPDAFESIDLLSPSNQSAYAVAGRWLCRAATTPDDPPIAVADLPLSVARSIAALAAVAVVVLLAAAAWRQPDTAPGARPGRSARDLALWSLVLLAACVLPRVGWQHYFVPLSLAHSLIGAAILRAPGGSTRTALIAGQALALAANWLHFASYTARAGGALLAATLVAAVTVQIAARVLDRNP